MRTIALVLCLGVVTPARAQEHTHHHSHTAASEGSVELDEQLERLRAATERYRDHASAVADGYKLFGAEGPLMGEHWYRKDLVLEPLDLERPSTLQYAWIDGKRQLIGVAYTVYQRPDEPLPDGFAGDSDVWHVHDVPKLARALTANRPLARWLVNRRMERGRLPAGPERTHLVMVHAWAWLDNPDGVFAEQHRALPYLRAGLPLELAAIGDQTAAWGVSLIDDRGCQWELMRLKRVAGIDQQQQKELSAECEHAADRVRSALAVSSHINSAASAAWTDYVLVRERLLRPDQHARLAAIIEHR